METASPEAPPVVEAVDLEIGYGDDIILRGVSFDVRPGEVFAILGGSGSGKSTLLRVLLGLLMPRKGSLRIAGRELVGASEEERTAIFRNVGVLFQSGALFGSLTLAENVALPTAALRGLPATTIEALASLTLSLVGLSGYEGHLPSEISGGMRKRAGIARAIALDPEILVLDEPSSGLDPVTADELDRLILALNRSLGVTVILVSHDLASIFAVAERCILVDKEVRGILARGTPAELRDSHPDPRVRGFFCRGA
jgi:phospholipid/cholesterol/gamma-HCH transport system ATP-binding protein